MQGSGITVSRTGWMPGWWAARSATTWRSTSRSARAGAESNPWRRVPRPTDLPARPSIGIVRQSPPSHTGTALAGTMAAPNPSKASEVMSRVPSTSALGTSS